MPIADSRRRSLDAPDPINLDARRRLDTPPAVALWRPEIVLASSIAAPAPRRRVTLASPAARPDAVVRRVESARTMLAALAEAREALAAEASGAHARAEEAASTRERVTATIAAYRAEAALDAAVNGTWRGMRALLEGRGRR